jgi:hypothetical protein
MKRKRYFEKRGRHPIIRELEGDDMRYVYYKKDNWFVLEDVVRTFFSVAKRGDFCCEPFFKKYIQDRAKFSRMGVGSVNIRLIRYKSPRMKFQEEDGKPSSVRILTSEEWKEKFRKKKFCMVCGSCIEDEETNKRKTDLLLIDFQSIQDLSKLMQDSSLSSLVSFLIKYAQLCRNQGKQARNGMTKKDRENVAASQGWKCKQCEKLFENGSLYEIDHITPVHAGGRNHVSNLQALCSSCHARKTDRDYSYPIVPITESSS